MAPYSDADRRLLSCALAGDGAGVRAALRGGAAHHLPGPDGRLPLHVAAAAGHADVITGLLQAGADLHARSGMPRDDGGRALHLAAEGGQGAALRVLAAAGAPLHAADDKGRTAVHWAALRGQQDALVTLHTLGCDLHALDGGHANALHFAVASGSVEAARWLVEVAGVSVAQLDLNNRSPYDVAKRKGHKHILSYLKSAQQQEQSQQPVLPAQQREQSQQPVLRRQSTQPGPSAWVYRQESPESQQETSVPLNQSQQYQHSLVSRSKSQDMSAFNQQSQQNQHTYPSRPKSQHDLSAWSQQDQHAKVSRAYSHQEQSATWSHGQQKPLSRQQSQRDTSAWIQSQQIRQQDEEPRSALTLLTHQNQDYRKKIAELEQRETEARQRSAGDQQSLAELSKEVDRLTAILQSQARESESGRQITALREEVQHLTIMLDDTGRRALATQEAQQRKIESLMSQEDLNKRTLTELTRRLSLADESNGAMMVEARDRERSESFLRGEVDRLKLTLSSAPQADAYAQVQARAHRLSEQDTIHRQAILALRRQLEDARTPTPAPPPPPVPITRDTDQRRVREAVLVADKSKEEAATLSARLQETRARAADAERMANAYKRQVGECERELWAEREGSGRQVAALKEELAEMQGRMEAVKRRAISSLTRAPTPGSSDP